MTGKRNIMFGVFYLLFALCCGLYAALGAPGLPEARHGLLNTAFVHAVIDAALNIAVGSLVCRLPFVGWVSRTLSFLMILGAVFHSGVLYLAVLNLLPYSPAFITVGSFLLISVLAFMCIGILSLRVIR